MRDTYINARLRGVGNLKLTPRLKIIADSVKGFDTLADIGSDHAYIPIYTVRNGWVKSAVATDVNSGPAEISRERIRNYELESRICVRQGNGLQILNSGEAEVIIVPVWENSNKRYFDKGAKAESTKVLILQR